VNHWVSAEGPRDVCTACGEKVPNAAELEAPVIITGQCKGAPPVRIAPDRPELALVVCTRCAHGAPYFDAAYLAIEIPCGRSGWCMRCRKFIGDVYSVVPARPPAQDLVQALVDAAGALVGGA
jgi:hypothetical protein